MRRTVFKLILSLLFIAVCTANAYALDMEFYTYGGFEPVTNAFLKISLIFSDANYKSLFYTVIVIGMLFGGIATFFAIARGSRTSPLAWAIPAILGVLIFFALIIPQGNITVYDPVVNRFQTISGVPDGIVAVAGTLNLIERGLIDIIYTSATPYSHRYQDFAGGTGFNVLLKSTGFPLKLPNQYMDKSLRNYMNDCLFFELMRPGTSLSTNDINSNSTNFLNEFAQAQNPAIFTTFYDDNPSDRTGTTMSCTQAWTNINSYLSNPLNFTEMVEYTCANSGFNPSDMNEMNKCRDTLRTYIDVVFGGAMGITEEHFLRQAYMAKVLNDVLLKNDPDLPLRVIANRNTMISGIGIGLIANDWLPIIRAVVTAVVIGLMPFFIIFIPTPVVGRALGIIIGFFIWLVSWGVTDAVVHGLSMDLTVNAFERIRDNQLGLVSMMYFPDESMKALGVFGMMRSFGIMIATVITTMLVKFGSHALAVMAGSLIGTVQSQGTGAAMLTQTPEGEAGLHERISSSIPTHAWVNKYALQERWRSGTFQKFMQTESSVRSVEAYGDVDTAADSLGHANAMQNMMHGSWGKQFSADTADSVGSVKGIVQKETALGKLTGAEDNLSTLGTVAYSQSMGEIQGAITAAKSRANVTGESWQNALVSNKIAASLFESAKNLGAEKYLAEIGFENASQSMTYGELERGHAALRKYDLGRLAGYDMDNASGRKAFYRDLQSAQGISIPVHEGNVDSINTHASYLGRTRFIPGSIALLKGDEDSISYIGTTSGLKNDLYDVGSYEGGIRKSEGIRVESGDKRINYDVDKTEIFKGTQATIVTPNGVKSGYMAYDADLRQSIFVAGSERYGIDRDVIHYREAQDITVKGSRGQDVTMHLPAGYVYEDVKVDPKSGAVVTGKSTSIHTTQGEVTFAGETYNAAIFTDMRTGRELAVDAKSGRFWTKTYNQDSWTVHRDITVRGEVFGSVVTKWFGKDAGKYVSDFISGIGEAGRVADLHTRRGSLKKKP